MIQHLFADEDEVFVLEPVDVVNEEVLRSRDAEDGLAEYKKVIRKWVHWKAPWREVYKTTKFPENAAVDPFDDLMNLDIKPMMDFIEKYNSDNSEIFGYLPLMCRNSKCQLGALNSEGFAERMNSAANLLVTKNRMLLGDEMIEQLVVLRINRNFMEFVNRNKKDPVTYIPRISAVQEENNNKELKKGNVQTTLRTLPAGGLANVSSLFCSAYGMRCCPTLLVA